MQRGGNIPVFAGTSYQRGHGLGRIVKAVWREATPILKQAGKRALKSGITAAVSGIFGKRKRKVYDVQDVRVTKRARPTSRGRVISAIRGRTVARGAKRSGRGNQTQKGSGQVSSRKRREEDVFDENFAKQENDN